VQIQDRGSGLKELYFHGLRGTSSESYLLNPGLTRVIRVITISENPKVG